MYIGLHVKYQLFTSHFKATWIFWTQLQKIFKYLISWKIRPVGDGLFHTDGQMDTHTDKKLIVTFTILRKRLRRVFINKNQMVCGSETYTTARRTSTKVFRRMRKSSKCHDSQWKQTVNITVKCQEGVCHLATVFCGSPSTPVWPSWKLDAHSDKVPQSTAISL